MTLTEIAAESFGTELAHVGLRRVVGVHVEGEVIRMMEGLMTHRTLVPLLTTVCQFVVLVVAVLMKPLSAVFTDERLEA